jgi:hypothetical protein
MASQLPKSDPVQACLKRINDFWRLHEPEDKTKENPVRCLAFVLDRRFVEEDELEMRLGVSFGGNPFLPNVPRGFLPPPVRQGEFIFGIHVIGTKGNQVALFDQWFDAREAGKCKTVEEAVEVANAILGEISDDHYLMKVCSDPEGVGAVQNSNRWLIEKFEIVNGESL